MLHAFLSRFFWYGTTMDVAQLFIKTKNTYYKRWETISGMIEIHTLINFQLYKDPISISLRWKTLGNDQRLRDFFQEKNIRLPKQTRQHPQVFNVWRPVFLNFSLKTEAYFNAPEIKDYIKQAYQNNQISRDQRSLQEIIESLETFSRHLQCVVSNTIKTLPLQEDNRVIEEVIVWLKKEKEKLKNS